MIPPVRLSGDSPRFTQANCRWGGVVIVEVIVDREGRVVSPRFLKREPPECLRRPIHDALSTWRFRPAQLEGEAVAVYLNLTINIHLQ